MNRLHVGVVALLCFSLLALPFGVAAQGLDTGVDLEAADAPGEEIAAQILINVADMGYTEEGELLLFATLTNLGNQLSEPLDLVAIVLNDCILPDLPQTCRFAAFGAFEQVTPNGIAAGTTVQWTFNFGLTPQVDLSRWSILWYQP